MNEKENILQTDTVENQTDSLSLQETAPLIEANNISDNHLKSNENNQESINIPESETIESSDSLSEPLSVQLETKDNSELSEEQEEQEEPKNNNLSNEPQDDKLSDESEEEPLDSLSSEWHKIKLTPMLTLPQLHDLHEQLLQYQHCRVQLCGEKVERVDTAALQLLLAFRNNPDITVGWVEPSAELCYAAQVVGLLSPLGLPCKEPPLFFQNH